MLLRWLLSNWLQGAARDRLFEAVSRAAEQQQETHGEPQEAADQPDQAQPPRPACDVGLVFALGIEAGGLEDRLQGVVRTHTPAFVVREGGLRGRSIALIEGGTGPKRAAAAATALIAGHRPQWLISAGFAGALQPELKRGDILMADRLLNERGEWLAIDLKVPAESRQQSPRLHVGPLLTVDRIIAAKSEKESLGREHQALAVDMESFAVAEVCRREKTRFLAVRIISDSLDDQLPPELDRLVRQKTTAGRLGAAVGAIVRRPSSVKDMLKLKEQALELSDRLAAFLQGVIVQLTPRRE